MRRRSLEKRLVFTLAFDNGWIDLDDWLYPYFRTGGSKNSFNLSDARLDQMLDWQRAEFDLEERRQLGYEIQRYLLGQRGGSPGLGRACGSDHALDVRQELQVHTVVRQPFPLGQPLD